MKPNQYLMAIDPFAEELKPSPMVLAWLRSFLRVENAELEVVYVHSTGSILGTICDPCSEIELKLKEYVATWSLQTPWKATVLPDRSGSTRMQVACLARYVVDIQARAVLLTSYGRKMLGRIALGSFADRLLAESPVPLIFIDSKPQKTFGLKRVLFPTDLSPQSWQAFCRFIRDFDPHKPEIILFHQYVSMLKVFEQGFTVEASGYRVGNAEDVRRYLSDRGSAWIKYAYQKGYSGSFVLSESKDTVVQAIREKAHSANVDLIALASSSGKIRTRILGSVASTLFYEKDLPVWICGPEAVREEFSALEGDVPQRQAGLGSAEMISLWPEMR